MIEISTPIQEGSYQASKWLRLQLLVDADELKNLFDHLAPFSLYPLTGPVFLDQIPISADLFLNHYRAWIEGLKEGVAPTDAALRQMLACAMSCKEEALWAQEVPGNRVLIKIKEPVIQVQAHFFSYSPIDEVFRSMVLGGQSVFWGLQFSYPQIFQHPKTMELLDTDEFPNAALFQLLRKWVRDFTRPTPFIVNGKQVNVPIRLGKNCFSWIDRHPQLKLQSLQVKHAN